MKFLKYFFNHLITFCIFINAAFANATVSFVKYEIETSKMCDAAFSNPSNPRKALNKLIKDFLKSQGQVCKRSSCLSRIDQESQNNLNFISRNFSQFRDINHCVELTGNNRELHIDHGTSFQTPILAALKLRAVQQRRLLSVKTPISLGTCPSLPLGFSAKSFSLSQRRTCDSFLQTSLASQSTSSNIGDITQISSMFISDEAILTQVDDPNFCQSCLEDKFAVHQLMNPGKSTSSDLDAEDTKQEFEKQKEKMHQKVSLHLASKRSIQQMFKLTNFLQQLEHFKYAYGFEKLDRLSCLNFEKFEQDASNKCIGINSSELKNRLNNVFSKVTGESVQDLQLAQGLTKILEKVQKIKSTCENGTDVTREHFFAQTNQSFEVDGRSSLVNGVLNSLFKSSNLFGNQNFQEIRQSNPNELLSISISKYLMSQIKMDSQNADEAIKLLFSSESEFSRNAVKLLKENTGLNIPLGDQEINSEIESKFINVVAGLIEQVSNVNPILNITLNNPFEFESIAKEYFRTPLRDRRPFSKFMFYGNHEKSDDKLKNEMQERIIQLLKNACDSVKENFIEALCDNGDKLKQYSSKEVKDAISEIREAKTERSVSDSIIQGAIVCEQNKEPDQAKGLILESFNNQSPYSLSDLALEAQSDKSSTDQAAGFFNAFSKSKERACNKQLAQLDIAAFRCQFRGECEQELSIIGNATFGEVQQTSVQAKVDSSKLQVSDVVIRAKQEIDKGKSFNSVDKVIAQSVKEESPRSVFSSNVTEVKPIASQSEDKKQLFEQTLDSVDQGIVESVPEKVLEETQVERQLVSTEQQFEIPSIIPTDSNTTSVYRTPAVPPIKRPASEDAEERAKLLASLSEDFTADQLEKLTNEQLKRLARTKEDSGSLSKDNLRERKSKLEQEIANLKEIEKLEQEKERLEQKRQKISEDKAKIGIPSRAVSSVQASSVASQSSSAPTGRTQVETSQSYSVEPSSTSTAGIGVSASQSKAFRSDSIKSQIPSDISSINQTQLAESVGSYLRAIEEQDLLSDSSLIQFEKRENKVIAVFVKSGEGKMVRIPVDKLDQKTQLIVQQYEKLSHTDIPKRESSVLSRLAQIEQEISQRKEVQSKRKTTLEALTIELSIFDKQIGTLK